MGRDGRETTRPAPEFIGLPEAAARRLADDLGRTFRVVERDGEPFMITADLCYGRVNAAITGGIVTAAREEYDAVADTLIRLVDLDVFAAAVEHRRPAWEGRGLSVEYRRGAYPSNPAARVVLESPDARGQLTVRVSGDAVIEFDRADDSENWRTTAAGVTSGGVADLLDDLATRVLLT